MIEVWKDIPNYEGYYMASNTGKVKSLDRTVIYKDGRVFNYKGNELIPKETKDGYLLFGLSKDGIGANYLAHRIIALCFVPNIENKPVVNHLDGNRKNNIYTNLEWCTQSENVLYSYNVLGYKVSEETRRKLSESGKNKVFTETHRKNLSLAQKGEKSHKSIPLVDLATMIKYVSLKDYAIKNNLNYYTTKGKWRKNKLTHLKKLS